MTYPTISSLPTAPDRTQPSTFSTRADAFVAALATFVSETNAAGDYVETKAGEADASATIASAAEDAVIASANATEWSSGASYSSGDIVWSPVDYQTYRAKTTHSGVTTDPSLDTTNWAQISLGAFDKDISITGELVATSYNETFDSVTSTSNAVTIDCENGNVFSHTLTENTTFTFSNPPTSGTAYSFLLKVVQDSTARTITWPASVDWPAGVAPTLSAADGETDVFVFFTHDGGTNWYGFTSGQALA